MGLYYFEKIISNFGEINKDLLVEYLCHMFKDLSSKDPSKERKEIKLKVFTEYISLPKIISKQLFRVLNPYTELMSKKNFVKGLIMLYTGSYTELVSLAFNFFDLESFNPNSSFFLSYPLIILLIPLMLL